MSDFHSLKVIDVRRETASCVSVAFVVPSDQREQFAYVSGQYLTFRHQINGEEVRRSYSICTAPYENELRVAIKQVPQGKFSTFANEVLTEGEHIDTMVPEGQFKHTPYTENQGTYVAFAAGSGITPIISIMKTILNEELNSQFILFYGNKTLDQVIFREEIEALKNRYLDRLSVYHLFSREYLEAPLFNGRIDKEKAKIFLKTLIPSQTDKFFLCGPESMIWSVKEALNENNIADEKIKFELFTTDRVPQGEHFVGNLEESQIENVAKVEVILDGDSFTFDLPFAGKSVLDAALEQGADLPYACKGGVCCTCKAKLLDGEVEMELNYGLEQDEIEKNFILTCQSHPRTGKITVDFDV